MLPSRARYFPAKASKAWRLWRSGSCTRFFPRSSTKRSKVINTQGVSRLNFKIRLAAG